MYELQLQFIKNNALSQEEPQTAALKHFNSASSDG